MGNHTRDVKDDEGAVRVSGGTTPDAFPHLCPYQPKGAFREFCVETTSNYHRNMQGCCGTSDHRNFAPCNSKFRKCHVCLVRGEGKLNRPVVDRKRGLCLEHQEEADAPASPKPALKPPRSIYFAPVVPKSSRSVRTRSAYQDRPDRAVPDSTPKEEESAAMEVTQDDGVVHAESEVHESPEPAEVSGNGLDTQPEQALPRRRGTDKATFLERVRTAREKGAHSSYLANFPPVDEMAGKLASLPKEARALVIASVSAGWSAGRQELAASERVSIATISTRLRKAFEALGIEQQPKRKKYFKRVLREYQKRQGHYDALANPPTQEDGSAEESSREVAVVTANGSGNGQDSHSVPMAGKDHVPTAHVQPDAAGAFLVRPPPGAKKITIIIDL